MAFAAASVADGDEAVAWLRTRGVEALFDTPRQRPEFARDEQSHLLPSHVRTPDRILFEFGYIGPK